MYIDSEDFLSLWQLAHQWARFDSDKTDESDLPDQVKLNLERLTAAIMAGRLQSRTKNLVILGDDTFFDILFSARHLYKLFRCRSGKALDKSYLESLFVRRPDFLEWCEKEEYPNADFWVLTQVIESNRPSNRPKDEFADKAVC